MFARLVPRPLIVCRRSPTTTCRRAHGCQRRWSALAELLSSVGGGGNGGPCFHVGLVNKKKDGGRRGGRALSNPMETQLLHAAMERGGPTIFFFLLAAGPRAVWGGEDPRKTHGCISRCGGPTRPTTQRTHGRPFLGAHEWPACSYEEDPRFNMKAW